MANYQYIVLPVQGSPYKVHMKQDEEELPFLQDKVDGYIEVLRNELILHPFFHESWGWVKNLIGGKAKYTVYVNEEGRRECCPNAALFYKGWSGVVPVMGNVLIKMTKKNFDKIKGKVHKNFEEMVNAEEESSDEDDERYCDNEECPYGSYICFEELEKYRNKDWTCDKCKNDEESN